MLQRSINPMNNERNKQIGEVFNTLERAPKALQKVLSEVCTRLSIENHVTEGEYLDYVAQVKSDEKMAGLMVDIIKVLQEVRFVHVHDSEQGRKEALANNDGLAVKIAMLIEKHEISLELLENVTTEIAGGLQQIVKSGVIRIANKCEDVVKMIAREKLGSEDLNAGEIARYIEQRYKEAAAKNEAEKQASEGNNQAAA